MIRKMCPFVFLAAFILCPGARLTAAPVDKKSEYVERVERISNRFGKQSIMDFILRKRNNWITIAVDDQLKDFEGNPSEEFITPKSIMYDLELIGYNLDEIESYLAARHQIRTIRMDIQAKQRSIAQLRHEVEGLNLQLQSYEKTITSLDMKHENAEQVPRNSGDNGTGGLFSPTCYDLGFRYGRCVARSFLELKCDPQDDFAMPERCKGKHDTQKGIEAGTRLILETSR